jgi:hypothetical protein
MQIFVLSCFSTGLLLRFSSMPLDLYITRSASVCPRFIYHGLSSTKVDTPVIFPIENLDLADYMAGPEMNGSNQPTYDLQSCVCHFGCK